MKTKTKGESKGERRSEGAFVDDAVLDDGDDGNIRNTDERERE